MDAVNSNLWKTHTHTISLYLGVFTTGLLVYLFLSSGEFSFFLTLSSIFRTFGMVNLLVKIGMDNTGKGVSVKTLQLYLAVFSFRLLSIIRHEGYLPFDKSGDHAYHLLEIISLIATAISIYVLMLGPLRASYDHKHDKFGNSEQLGAELGALWLFMPCVILAIGFHPGLNKDFFSDTCWTISMYIEGVSMIPQLFMFSLSAAEEGGVIETRLGHTVALLGFSRVFELLFWAKSYHELIDERMGSTFASYMVLLTQIVQLVIMGDFFYYYIKAWSKGEKMVLPMSEAPMV